MSTCNFQPDDPRLTAYALGELDPNERAEVEAMLAESAEARTALEEIRETIGLLSRELTFEPALTLTMTQRQAVEQAVGVEVPASETRATVVAPTSVKSARWVLIVRTATTVAVVAAVAVAVPWVSRGWRDGSQNPSANADRTVASTSSPNTSEIAEQRTGPLGHSSLAALDDSRSLILPSHSPDAFVASNGPDHPDAAVRMSTGEVAGKSLSEGVAGESPFRASTDSIPGRQPLFETIDPVVASTPLLAGTGGDSRSKRNGIGDGTSDSLASSIQLSGVAESKESRESEVQGQQSGYAGEAKTNPLKFGAGVGGPPLALYGEPDGKSDSLRLNLTPGVAESMGGRVSVDLGRAAESDSKVATTFSVYGDRGEALADFEGRGKELKKLEESMESHEGRLARFRSLKVAAPGTEAYEPIVENAFLTPLEQSLSTFSIDVDTASYANMRRFIQQGQLPPANAVRIEELVNYFRYDYPEPADGSPFSVNIDVATCPWNPQNKLARVGLKAKTIAEDKRPATNLVFLIDVSGSMAAENKLPLVKQALSVLVSKMGEDDQIAIVTYAGEAGLKLNSTSGSQRAVIQKAIDSLQSGGSTNGAAGINIAYDTAIQSFIKGGANRVILCTDGDFNVGVSDDNTLVEMIQEKAASGVFLSVFGFGMGNLKDAKLEKLADKGNGNYGYIDGLGEARKVFGEQLSGTLVTVAKDVKLQLEFNNSTVGAYRLIGYENRVLAAKDFDDDTKDAGEIGAGHTVTALYEIVPKAAWLTQQTSDTNYAEPKSDVNDGRLFTVKLRHKLPDAETSEKSQDYAAMDSDTQLSDSNVDFRFAAAVASFGMQIRESKFRGNWTLQNVLSMADASLSTDRNGERTEFTDLVRGVMRIKGDTVTDPRLTMHETVVPAKPSAQLPTELPANDARSKATVDGKYRRLLKKIEVRSDVATYGEFRDYGRWDESVYSGHSNLPAGYWVWVYPNWYIWGDVVETENRE